VLTHPVTGAYAHYFYIISMAVAHVIGLGRSGVSSARVLQRQGWSVSLSDAGDSETLRQRQQSLEAEGFRVYLGTKFSLATLVTLGEPSPGRVVVSPGVSWTLPALVEARDQGIEVMGEMELAWLSLGKVPWIGITGTNGKTTTTALVAAMLKAGGLKAPACGNIGYSVCDLVLADEPIDWVVAEISSYQIESSTTLAPTIGVWTTFTPDHLERHSTIENYWGIKTSLLERSQHRILNGDDPAIRAGGLSDGLRPTLGHRWPHAHWMLTDADQISLPENATPYSTIKEGWVEVQGQRILPVDSLRMPGGHNLQNLLMATTAAVLAGVEPAAIAQAVAEFSGVAHRLELVGTLDGIELINDSKATNYDAAQTGLAAMTGPTVLIAGGDPKVGDDSAWLQTIQEKAIAVLLIGDAAVQFSDRLLSIGYTAVEIVETMERAVPRAIELARPQRAKVLLSPACASFDQYNNFEERGDHFRSLCQTYGAT
jgi:UDP-N-acetylmuramoylalanine--D-glutamate ligase